MRTKSSILNSSTGFLVLLFRTVMTFVVRTVFIKVLGVEYLGLNGLFTNLLTMLSLAELGVGVSISYSLYKPLAYDDYEKISTLMSLYKKIYYAVGIGITVIGLVLVPFLHIIIGEVSIENIYLIYFLYLFNTASVYFFSYKETLIVADQRSYRLTPINLLTWVAVYFSQIAVLLVLHSYIGYLLSQFVCLLVQRIAINRYVTKEYQHINFNSKNKLEKSDLDSIKINIKSMFMQKVGLYLVNGFDNIIISTFIGVATVGYYSNYISLTTMTNSLINTIFIGVTASLGNLVALESDKAQERVFGIMNFIGFIIYGFSTLCFLLLIDPFISIWIGSSYILDKSVVICICLNFYLTGINMCHDTIKAAAGLYRYDKWIPLMQAMINLVVSIGSIKYIGLLGVVLGTVVSYMVLPFWQRPRMIYKHVFHSSPRRYFMEYGFRVLVIGVLYIGLSALLSVLPIGGGFVGLILKAIVVVAGYVPVICILYWKNEYFCFCKNLVFGKLKFLKK